MKQTGVNNLSQQLCELCGIEPIFLSNCSFENEVRLGRSEGIDICKYENGECSCSECELGTTYTALFPDFENPENFVKLLEIYHQNDCYIDTYNFIAEGVHSFVEAFLRYIVDILSRDMDDLEIIEDFGRETIIKLKQAIAAEEWEY